MTRHIKVHVCIADPVAGLAVRKLLAANPNVLVTPWRTEHAAQSAYAHGIGSDVRDGELFADIDVLLLGPEDLSRFEENEPGRIEELQRRVKVLMLLRSEELPASLELLRHCDGMIVRDVNLGNISDIIEFALHGYFVIPYNLMANFNFTSALTRVAFGEQIGSGQNGLSTIGRRDFSRDIATEEYCATRKTMRIAIRNVLKHRKNAARAQLRTAATGRAAEEPSLNLANKSAARLARWRRALRDDDGRVATGEYVLMFAALAIWGAIILDAGAAIKSARMFGWCASIASSVQCGAFASAPVGGAAASLAGAAKRPAGSGDALRKSVEDEKDPE